MTQNMNRRRVLAGISLGGTLALAGCTGGPDIDYREDVANPVVGDENAPVTLTYFFNLTCPACARFNDTVQPNIDSEYISEGVVKQEYISVTSSTNRDAADPLHSGAYYIYEEVGPEAFAEFRNRVYLEDATARQAISIGADVGANESELEQAIIQNIYRPVLEEDIAESERAGVTGTPTVAVNGRVLGSPSWEAIQNAVEAELE